MARIDYPDLTDPDPETRPVLKKISTGRPFVPNPYRLLLWSREVTEGWVGLANAVRFESGLDDRSRELAILLVSHLTGCDYEWQHHSQLAGRAGISPEEVEALRAWPSTTHWGADDRALLAVVAAMCERRALPAQELEALRASLGEKRLVELGAAVAYYLGLAHFLLAFEVELEAPPEQTDR